MLGMTNDEVSALSAIAQVVLSLATLLGSIAVSVFVWYGTKRIARLEYERSIRDAWIAIDTAALSSDEMLVIADTLENPSNASASLEARRKRWFAYTYLNAVVSYYFGTKHGLTQSRRHGLEACRQLLRPLMLHDEVFEITQGHGYEPEFSALCRQVRAQVNEERTQAGTQPPPLRTDGRGGAKT